VWHDLEAVLAGVGAACLLASGGIITAAWVITRRRR
jgi:hypothetical protein